MVHVLLHPALCHGIPEVVEEVTVTHVYIMWGVMTVLYAALWIYLYVNGPKIRAGLKSEIRRLLKDDEPLPQFKNTLIDPSKFTKRR